MTLRIDWDNYEVIEKEDFDLIDLENTIEDVRETMDHLAEACGTIPETLEELLVTLTELEEELEDESQTEGQ